MPEMLKKIFSQVATFNTEMNAQRQQAKKLAHFFKIRVYRVLGTTLTA